MNGQFNAGAHAFNVNNFSYPTRFPDKGYTGTTVQDLVQFLTNQMALYAPTCNAECMQNVATYLWSYRTVTNEKVQVQNISYDETGLGLDLSCTQGNKTVVVKVLDPAAFPDTTDEVYSAVTSRAAGLTSVAINSIATLEDNGEIALVGEGSNIWGDEVWFNALAEPVEDGELDVTLNINSVTNVEHEFAKVGILVSSTDDLSGELLFLHWSGRNGLAEDSGNGGLTGYTLFLANPEPGALTPTPTTLRVTYESGALKVGGCYGCASPAMQAAARSVNFVPKRIFIVASSHNAPAILANVEVINGHRDTPTGTLYETRMACGASPVTVTVPKTLLRSLAELKLAIYENGELLTEKTTGKTWSPEASCEVRDGLLEPKLRRLSERQIMNSLRDIFGDIFTDELSPNMEDGAKLIGMNTLADRLNINTINLERLYDSSREVVRVLLERHSAINQCSKNSSAACVTSLLDEYAPKLWRRPLTTQERAELTGPLADLDSNARKLEFTFNSLILSSNFLFRSEIGDLKDGVRVLNNYEIVTLLAYTIWNSTPDATLLTLAQKSSPLTVEELQTQVDRMIASSKANAALVELYKDYLKLEMALTNEKADDLEFTDSVRAELMRSAEMMLADLITPTAGYMDVFSGNRFYVSRAVQSFFNTTSSSDELEVTSLNASQRHGILNHPIFLSAHSTLTHSGIIKRGVFTLEQLLCEPLGAPPTEVESMPPPEDMDPATTSERVLLQVTHSSRPACIGCHQFIDPAGFGFENFDVVGRYRTVEKGSVPIDASGILETASGSRLTYANSAEYAEQLTSSQQMNACVSRRFLEHYLSQELRGNSCELSKYQTQLEARGHTVKSLLDSLIRLESFTKRKQLQ
jgi:Protein of unknown function (DUF1592)./Protein of unknown function (DUF1588).